MPFYTTYKFTVTNTQTANNVYYRANEWGIGYYHANGDARESRVYEPGTGGMIGVAYGLPPVNENASPILAGIGPGLYKTSSSPQMVLSSAESFFLQAEAKLRGFITGGPSVASLMASGITESFVYLGSTSAAAASYMSGNAGWSDVDVTAVSNTPPNVLSLTPPVGGISPYCRKNGLL